LIGISHRRRQTRHRNGLADVCRSPAVRSAGPIALGRSCDAQRVSPGRSRSRISFCYGCGPVSYSHELPASRDVLLAVEVADTTLRYDRLVKARLYARAGIAEFWLCVAADGVVEVHRGPSPDGYADVTRYGSGQAVSPLAFPDVSFAVTDFFA
jgi:Uma2 family endonuclease